MQNSITITGRITRDPELKQISSGDAVLRFSLACSRDYKDKKTGEYLTDFIDCEAWRQNADYLGRYAHKGDTVQATGRLQLDDWTDDNGNKRRSAKVQCEKVYLISTKSHTGESNPQGFSTSGEPEQSKGNYGGNYGGNQQNGYNKGYGNQGGYGTGYGGG